MATINELQDEIIEDFSLFDDWMGKYEHLIEFGKSLPLLNKEHKIEENEVKGCQSKVWLHTACKDGKIYFKINDSITRSMCFIFFKSKCSISNDSG